jgi:hypothetical protein
MLVQVFSSQDDGFVALLQLSPDGGLVRAQGIRAGAEAHWKDCALSVASIITEPVPLDTVLAVWHRISGSMNFMNIVEGKADSDFDTVFRETLAQRGASTGERVFRSYKA